MVRCVTAFFLKSFSHSVMCDCVFKVCSHSVICDCIFKACSHSVMCDCIFKAFSHGVICDCFLRLVHMLQCETVFLWLVRTV